MKFHSGQSLIAALIVSVKRFKQKTIKVIYRNETDHHDQSLLIHIEKAASIGDGPINYIRKGYMKLIIHP